MAVACLHICVVLLAWLHPKDCSILMFVVLPELLWTNCCSMCVCCVCICAYMRACVCAYIPMAVAYMYQCVYISCVLLARMVSSLWLYIHVSVCVYVMCSSSFTPMAVALQQAYMPICCISRMASPQWL